MSQWTIAAVQMDCKLADKRHNLEMMKARLQEAAGRGARLVVFPECALTGYCYESREEALPLAETLPGSSTEALSPLCHELGVWTVFGLLERDGERLYNAGALVGPDGYRARYRKLHLPFLGIDRFVRPGDEPFAVHDLGGLRVGINICFDGSFPESARVLALLGADLVALPTNWPTASMCSARHVPPLRALENHIYYAAVNRVGTERGFTFLGNSQIVGCDGQTLASAEGSHETTLYATIDPDVARQKQVVIIPGKFEVNRITGRRPEMYGPLVGKEE